MPAEGNHIMYAQIWGGPLIRTSIKLLISWDKITKSKRRGGLGIRDLEDFNIALLAKNPQSLLARAFKANYYRHSDFLEAKSYSTSSYGWRSIIQIQDLLRKGLKWIVGNREKIRVRKDNWIRSSLRLLLQEQIQQLTLSSEFVSFL